MTKPARGWRGGRAETGISARGWRGGRAETGIAARGCSPARGWRGGRAETGIAARGCSPARGWWGARPVLLLASLFVAGLGLRLLHAADFVHRAGGFSPPVLVALGALACAFGLPRQIIAFAAGFAHGLGFGFALAMAAQLLGSLADYSWGRLVARDRARQALGRWFGGRLARLGALLDHEPFTVTLMLRLLPFGNNLALGLLAGTFGIRPLPFLAATFLGYIPQTLIFAAFGKGMRVGHATMLAVSLAGFAISAGLGLLLARRLRRTRADLLPEQA